MTLNPYLMTEGAEIEEVVAGPADLSGQMVAWTSLGVWLHCSSFWGLPYRILNRSHKQEL